MGRKISKYPPRTPETKARISAGVKAYHAQCKAAVAIVESMKATS